MIDVSLYIVSFSVNSLKMNFKIIILFASLAYAAAAIVPQSIAVGDLHGVLETEDAFYLPISAEEAEQLRLPREVPSQVNHYAFDSHRSRRSVDDIFETEEAYYIPVSKEEEEYLRLPRSIDNAEESELFYTLEEGDVHSPALLRPKRQLNLQGGGSPGQGYDVSAQGRAKLWESDNGRNLVHGTAQYSQHLGGPYGNSQPNVGGGLMFTHRF